MATLGSSARARSRRLGQHPALIKLVIPYAWHDVSWYVQLQSALFFETPHEIFARVFSEWKPRTPAPAVRLKFCKFANANSFIRWDEAGIEIRITDVLEGAPAPILEALANILISKLVRRPVPKIHAERYRRYLNRKEMRRSLQLVKQVRGRRVRLGPARRLL